MSETFLLAVDFGNTNDPWGHGPFNLFFYCESECDSFPVPTATWVGHFQLFSTIAESVAETLTDSDVEQIPEPATLALLGLGLVGLGVSRRRKTN